MKTNVKKQVIFAALIAGIFLTTLNANAGVVKTGTLVSTADTGKMDKMSSSKMSKKMTKKKKTDKMSSGKMKMAKDSSKM